MATYALLLRHSANFDPRPVAEAIAEIAGQTPLDAMWQLHHGRGVLAQRLSNSQAQRAGGALTALGLAVYCVPAGELLDLPREKVAAGGRPTAEGLELVDALGRSMLEPWDQLLLIGCAGICREAAEAVPGEAWPAGPERPTWRVGEEPAEQATEYHLGCCFGRRRLRYYRLDLQRFNYQYLADGGRLGLRGAENLVRLTADLAAPAGRARLTPAAAALARGELLPAGRFATLRQFEAQLRWHLICRRSWPAGSAPGEPGIV